MVTKIQIAGKLKFYTKPYGRQWKWRYQTHGHVMEPSLRVPKKLQNTKIIDPLNPERDSKEENKILWKPPRRHPALEQFFAQPTLKDHPNYKETPVKLFSRSCKFHAGIDQASLLTKTKAIQGLPGVVENAQNYKLRENNDSLVENYLKQALAYNPTKVVCPRLKIPHDVKFMIAREYATPQDQQMKIILENLIRLCNINMSAVSMRSVIDRKLVQSSPLSIIVERGDELIQLRRNSEFAMFSKKSLKPLADSTEIQQTLDHKFVDMYPVFPTIDLLDEHVYDLNTSTFGWRHDQPVNKFSNLHTFFHVNDDQLNDKDNVSRLMAFAFGAAIAQSKLLRKNKALELDDNLALKTPIVVNGVSISNSHRLNYIMYQLNTLNFKDNTGVKNICYYDMNNELYYNRPTVEKLPYPTHKNIQRLVMRQLEYNPEAFRKLQSVIAYGAQ